jgi:2-polyprenyl-3-methyl-5-hydroxy-6-metoxy-1,4-benzoquinol methylase
MNDERRNLSDYVEKYCTLPFEPIQIEYRRKLVLNQVIQSAPRRLLEVGCGTLPLFTDLSEDIAITVVEPAQEFVDRARQLATGRNNVNILQGYIETVDIGSSDFDMIVLSCVLHEVPKPSEMLEAIRGYCSAGTTLHVNVPNANSLHRLLAVSMGLIPSTIQQSDMQLLMQQRDTPYNANSLRAELSSSGFDVVDEGSLFVKPFTHAQMQSLVDSGFMTRSMLDGFDKLVNWLPDLGSEIWANSRRVK